MSVCVFACSTPAAPLFPILLSSLLLFWLRRSDVFISNAAPAAAGVQEGEKERDAGREKSIPLVNHLFTIFSPSSPSPPDFGPRLLLPFFYNSFFCFCCCETCGRYEHNPRCASHNSPSPRTTTFARIFWPRGKTHTQTPEKHVRTYVLMESMHTQTWTHIGVAQSQHPHPLPATSTSTP